MNRNMARHLRLKHPSVYFKVSPYLDKSPIKGPLKSTSWLKGSWAKKYCKVVTGNKYKCNMCPAVLSLSNGLFGNMKRHIKSKHPHVYEKEVGGGRSSDEVEFSTEEVENTLKESESFLTEFIDESVTVDAEDDSESESEDGGGIPFLSEIDPDFKNKIKYLCMKEVEGKKRARNCFWNFFNVIKENRRYSCLACNRRVSIFPHSIANLKRHIKMRHKKQYEIMMNHMSETETSGKVSPVSFDKYYFDHEGDTEYKCKECGNIITCADEDQHTLFDHIKDIHPDQIMAYQEEAMEYDDDQNIVIVKCDSF